MDPHLSTYLDSPEKLAEIPVSDIPAVLTQLAAMQLALAARLFREPARTELVPIPPDGLLTVEKAAQRLDFTEQYVYSLIKKGSLPAIRHGKYVRIREPDLIAWIDKHYEKWLDKDIYGSYSSGHGRKRASQDSAVSRHYAGSNGGANRRGAKHRGAMGAGRVEDIRTRLPADPSVGRDEANKRPPY